MRRGRRYSWIAAFGLAGLAAPAGAQSLPDGFLAEFIAVPPFTGAPVGFAVLPDERVLLCERNSGAVRLSPVGSTATTVIHTVPDVVWDNPEQGLLAVMVDSDWPSRPYVYVYYTHVDSSAYLTMYTASGDLTSPTSTNLALGNPYHVLTDLPDEVGRHNGGTIRFGPDDMLYLSLGDDQAQCLAQDSTAANGSVLRLDVSTLPGAGSGPPPKADITPADNPFSGSSDEWARLLWAWGFRNPFRFTIDPLTGDLFVGDVGLVTEEEVDQVEAASPGGNYGWPQREGFIDPMCCGSCGAGHPFVDPIYSYPHDALPKSVIGGPRYRPVTGGPANFPASYDGSVFFVEWFDGWIRRLEHDGSSWALAAPVPGQPDPVNWAEGFPECTDFEMGRDGSLYLLKASGTPRGLYRIYPEATVGAGIFASATSPPLVTPNPASLATGITFRFHVARSGLVALRVVDVGGRRVRTVVERTMPAGMRTAHWNGRGDGGTPAPAGTYFYRLELPGGSAATGKLSLLK